MQQGLRKAQADQWICRDFSQVLDAQEIGASRVKNRSIWVIIKGLGLALTSIIGNSELTFKTCAVPGTQQGKSLNYKQSLKTYLDSCITM